MTSAATATTTTTFIAVLVLGVIDKQLDYFGTVTARRLGFSGKKL
jgi:hypothetical protein